MARNISLNFKPGPQIDQTVSTRGKPIVNVSHCWAIKEITNETFEKFTNIRSKLIKVLEVTKLKIELFSNNYILKFISNFL